MAKPRPTARLSKRKNGGGWSAPPLAAPTNVVAPAISGTPTEGQTLTVSDGSWNGNPTPTYTYQWKRAGVSIGGATTSSYLLVSADVGTNTIKCAVTATNSQGSASQDSNTVTVAAASSSGGQLDFSDPDAEGGLVLGIGTNVI